MTRELFSIQFEAFRGKSYQTKSFHRELDADLKIFLQSIHMDENKFLE